MTVMPFISREALLAANEQETAEIERNSKLAAQAILRAPRSRQFAAFVKYGPHLTVDDMEAVMSEGLARDAVEAAAAEKANEKSIFDMVSPYLPIAYIAAMSAVMSFAGFDILWVAPVIVWIGYAIPQVFMKGKFAAELRISMAMMGVSILHSGVQGALIGMSELSRGVMDGSGVGAVTLIMIAAMTISMTIDD